MKYSGDRTENSSDFTKRVIKIIAKFFLIIFSILILKSLLCFGNLNKSADLIDQEDPYPQWVAEQLALLGGDISLGQWKKIRPDETILLFNHRDAEAGLIKIGPPITRNWCARAEARLDLGDGTEAIRYAFFYPPEPPENLELPEEQDADSILDRQSTLGLILTQRMEKSIDRGEELARRVRTAIDQRFGQGQSGFELLGFPVAGFWSETGRWHIGTATSISAYLNSKYDRTESKVVAFIFLPISQQRIELMPYPYRWLGINSKYDKSDFPGVRAREMIAQSGISGYEKKFLLDVLTEIEVVQLEKYPGIRGLSVGRIDEAIRRWMATAQKLDARHKAAALLAADVVLFMENYFSVGVPEIGAQARQEMSKLGAEFVYERLGGTFVYTRTWLKKALEIDPEGPAGELAFRILMEMGFDTSGTCSGGRYQFSKVIEQGELYLQKNHDKESLAAVKRMVGDAYRDIVSIANGALGGFSEEYQEILREEYRGTAPEARRKAIQYYRKTLPKTKYTYEAIIGWTDAWRMIAGLPPIHMQYYCFYD